MEHIFKRLLALSVVILLSACIPGLDSDSGPVSDKSSRQIYHPNEVPGTATILNIDNRAQKTDVWCWAATIEITANYYGVAAQQCATLAVWTGFDCCNTYSPYCVRAGSNYEIQESLRLLGLNSSFAYGPLSWNQVKTEINSGRPMIMFYSDSFSGHVVVMFGYDETTKKVYIHDPYFGTFEVDFGTTFSYNNSKAWTNTLYNISKSSF